MAEKALLIGNGLNRVSGDCSWHDLLDDIIKLAGKDGVVRCSKSKPLTLLYEEIYLRALQQSGLSERCIKEEIAKVANEVRPNRLHARVFDVGCSHILTTNYDYALEKAYPNGGRKAFRDTSVVREQRYSLFRRKSADDITIWHIHGEQSVPRSIALGFEHYAGHLQKVRDYAFTGLSYARREFDALVTRLDEACASHAESWVDFFFTSDMYILGLSMDFVELHLWWLLVYRARRLASKDRRLPNRIVYLWRGGCVDASQRDKLDVLRSAQVEVLELADGLSWEEYYRRALDRVENY